MSRIRLALHEFGGALLCDEVGMGKTFVAAAIAREYSAPLVVAPATLTRMWKGALAATGIRADFVSFEKLGRGSGDSSASRPMRDQRYDVVIIDEAHHARNRATQRYARLIKLTRDAKVLLLSATPIHNRRDEMFAVLSLFLGSRSNTLTPAELSRCVLRRSHAQLENRALIPKVLLVNTLQVSDEPLVVRNLMSLPDPVPVRDGGLGGVLIGRGLIHQWASSEAALRTALRRRAARAAALIASLEAGTYPTENELRAWTFDDGALQLGFAELLSTHVRRADALLDSVRNHAAALDAFRRRHAQQSLIDMERAEHVLAIRRLHPDGKIVAFSQYTPTVSMLYRQLRSIGGVAMLTSHGAYVAGGKLSRHEALARFAPLSLNARRPARSEAIDILLTTDLLSEGVNLQDAQIVVHLDLPWTAARMEQRVGRVARLGSPHSVIHAYLIRPPASADAFLATGAIIDRKWDLARRTVGSSVSHPLAETPNEGGAAHSKSTSQLTESLRSILERWRQPESTDVVWNSREFRDSTWVAAAESHASGFLAAVTVDDRSHLVVGVSGHVSTELELQIAACNLTIGADVEVCGDEFERAHAELLSWAAMRSASAMAGISASKALRRRRLVNRIDAAIECAPPQSRSNRLAAAARARAVVAAQQNAAIEADLDSLADSDLADDEWLEAIAHLREGDQSKTQRTANRDFTIHALLLLRGET